MGITEDGLRQFVDQWEAAFNSRDPDRVLDLCHEDVIVQDPAVPAALEGRSEVRDLLEDTWTAFPDLELEVIAGPYLALDGSGGSLRWRAAGTMQGPLETAGFAPTEGPVQWEGVDEYVLDDGQLQQLTVTYDMFDIGRQIGAAPEPGSAAEKIAALMQRLAAWRQRQS